MTAGEVDKILAAARREAERQGVKVGIAVVDDGGYLQGSVRLDGASVLSVESVRLKVPSQVIADTVKASPGFACLPDILPLQGGVPIMVGEHCVGAVGVGGALPHQDELIAQAGIAVLSQSSASAS